MKSTRRVLLWESEAPAELAPPWFGRNLTLPSNELVRESRRDMFTRSNFTACLSGKGHRKP